MPVFFRNNRGQMMLYFPDSSRYIRIQKQHMMIRFVSVVVMPLVKKFIEFFEEHVFTTVCSYHPLHIVRYGKGVLPHGGFGQPCIVSRRVKGRGCVKSGPGEIRVAGARKPCKRARAKQAKGRKGG